MDKKELEKRAAVLSAEYNRVQNCIVKMEEIEDLEAEIAAKRAELEKEILPVEQPTKPAIVINPAKTYVTLDKTEIPCITKGSVTYPKVSNAVEAFNQATENVLSRIYNGDVKGVYDSLGECPGVSYNNGWRYDGWGLLTPEENDWKSPGFKLDNRFTSHKIVVIQVGNKFCCGAGASSAMSAIIRAILWNTTVDAITIKNATKNTLKCKCAPLTLLCTTLTQNGTNSFRDISDSGLKGNNGYVVSAFISILEFFGVRDILDSITFWSCPGKGCTRRD